MALAMKKFLFFLTFCSISITGINAQWVQQVSGTTNYLHSIRFFNDNTGWTVGGNGTVLKTTNGGTVWISQNSGTSNILLSFYTIDGINIWAVGTYGVIIKSTNSGSNWVLKTSGTTTWLRSVFFLNSSIGWAGGDVNLLKTTNGGENWVSLSNSLGIPVCSVYFFNINTGVVIGGSSIKKTTDAGLSWVTVQFYCCHSLMSSYFVDLNTGWAVGTLTYPNLRYGEALKTTDNGLNWNGITTPSGDGEYYSVFFTNSLSGWVSGYQGLIIKTDNGGTNWHHQLSGTNSYLMSIYFVNTMTGWAAGSNGTILKTTNGGGVVGIKQIGINIPSTVILYDNYPNPFNPVTKIKYNIPPSKGARGMMVRLTIYDVLGREIENLVNQSQKPGSYEVTWDGSRYASGVYFYKLVTDEFIETKKMVLIK
jgi:photosystem II stability/assembly factor-like uncharacterized protein